MCLGDMDLSYLDHKTDKNDFTRNGIHFATWCDVFFNWSARVAGGMWKELFFSASYSFMFVFLGKKYSIAHDFPEVNPAPHNTSHGRALTTHTWA
jgi:hypothetical protein